MRARFLLFHAYFANKSLRTSVPLFIMVSKSKTNSSLSGGAIAGIVVAVVVVLIVLAAAAFFLTRRRRNARSQSTTQLSTMSSPISDYEKISPVAPQLPSPAVERPSDKEVERMYLRSSASIGNAQAPRFSQEIEPPLPRGKLAKLTGNTPPRSLSDMAPKARIQALKPAGERRTVPYRPDDFA
jgi:cell division protein FtsN